MIAKSFDSLEIMGQSHSRDHGTVTRSWGSFKIMGQFRDYGTVTRSWGSFEIMGQSPDHWIMDSRKIIGQFRDHGTIPRSWDSFARSSESFDIMGVQFHVARSTESREILS